MYTIILCDTEEQQLRSGPNQYLRVSLYSLNSNSHDRATPIAGATWDLVLAGNTARPGGTQNWNIPHSRPFHCGGIQV